MRYWGDRFPILAAHAFEADLAPNGRFTQFGENGYFCICDETGRAIGRIDYEGFDLPARQAELSILIGEKDAWSKGYGTRGDHAAARMALQRSRGAPRLARGLPGEHPRPYAPTKKSASSARGQARSVVHGWPVARRASLQHPAAASSMPAITRTGHIPIDATCRSMYHEALRIAIRVCGVRLRLSASGKEPNHVLKMRLTRMGAKGQPHYRIVVQEARSKRDGRYRGEPRPLQPAHRAEHDRRQCRARAVLARVSARSRPNRSRRSSSAPVSRRCASRPRHRGLRW